MDSKKNQVRWMRILGLGVGLGSALGLCWPTIQGKLEQEIRDRATALQSSLSRRVGLPVRWDEAILEWRAGMPALILKAVEIGDRHRIKELSLTPSWRSMIGHAVARGVRLDWVELDQVSGEVRFSGDQVSLPHWQARAAGLEMGGKAEPGRVRIEILQGGVDALSRLLPPFLREKVPSFEGELHGAWFEWSREGLAWSSEQLKLQGILLSGVQGSLASLPGSKLFVEGRVKIPAEVLVRKLPEKFKQRLFPVGAVEGSFRFRGPWDSLEALEKGEITGKIDSAVFQSPDEAFKLEKIAAEFSWARGKFEIPALTLAIQPGAGFKKLGLVGGTGVRVKLRAALSRERATLEELQSESDLDGLSLALPMPLSKKSSLGLKLRADWRRSTEDSPVGWSVRLDGPGIKLGVVKPLDSQRVKVNLNSDWLDALGWRDWFTSREIRELLSAAIPSSADSIGDANALNWGAEIGRLTWGRRELHACVGSGVGLTEVEVRCRELEGRARWTREPHRVAINLSRLSLPALGPSPVSRSKSSAVPPSGDDLASWPSLDFQCAKTEISGLDLGQVEVRLEQGEGLIQLANLRVLNPRFEVLSESGAIMHRPARVRLSGRVRLPGASYPFEKGMKLFLEQGRARFDLAWSGGPFDGDVSSMEGSLVGYAQRGRVEGVRSFVSGLFNVMSLRFADARKQLMRFDKASFDIGLTGGKLSLRYLRALFGSVFVKLEGQTDLESRKLDLKGFVTPSVSDIRDPALAFDGKSSRDEDLSVPELEEEPQALFSRRFRVEGNWDSPEVRHQWF